MPKILVTNDDGYFSEGIEALSKALEAVGEVTMVAPASEQSATAHSLTLTRPLRARQIGERRYTVAGALEASIFRLPGIAVSLAAREGDFTRAANFAADLTVRVLKEGLPEGTILNVNVPVGEIRGARLTHQGVVSATPEIVEGVDPRGRAYYWVGIQKISLKEDRGSDYAAIGEGLVSITPLRTDMTDYRTLEALRSHDLFGFDVQS